MGSSTNGLPHRPGGVRRRVGPRTFASRQSSTMTGTIDAQRCREAMMDPSSPNVVPPTDPSLESEFRGLVEQWRAETADSSLVQKQVQHPAYRRIIELGPR